MHLGPGIIGPTFRDIGFGVLVAVVAYGLLVLAILSIRAIRAEKGAA